MLFSVILFIALTSYMDYYIYAVPSPWIYYTIPDPQLHVNLAALTLILPETLYELLSTVVLRRRNKILEAI